MVPRGLLPLLLAAMVKVILIQMKTGESLGAALIPETIHGVDSHKQESLHSSGRERRELVCQKGYYPHPNETHCCIKCHKGTYLAQHCSGPEKTPNCSECSPGTYMSQDNFYRQCFPCSGCRASFGQIEISRCTPEQDTVCGCGLHQYQSGGKSEFFCQNCSACENGKIRQHCTKFNDTICECHPGYFRRTDENNCSPCSSCNDQKCKQHCEPMSFPVANPSNSQEITYGLGSLAFLFGFGCVILLLAKKIKWQLCQKKQNSTSCSYSLNPEKTGEPTSKTNDKGNYSALCRDDEVQQSSQTSPTVPLPDCVKSAGETQVPDRPEVLYTIVDHVPLSRWKEFMRYLGLSENTIDIITIEQRHMREAQYEMLRHWRLQAGHGASVERISNVLNQMNLSGCSEAIQEVLTKQP
ncbi:tumor necrosis factor receptor superfamily member 1A-like [Sceloporus undulatus]|uniref:tumor necrosis factor receptor superfamily member 1A-like n=1 Tax=Sceloporus undulatus TaxID=8520 RepID=UPI001C4ABD97|nr:tumor necrosis factor receptor superfamily member 1A-like [Sceloporus undulatus]